MTLHRLCPHCNQPTPTTTQCNTCHNKRYGTQHRNTRQQWTPQVNTGNQPCARANHDPTLTPHNINPTQPWHLDHLPDGTIQPSCSYHNTQHTGN